MIHPVSKGALAVILRFTLLLIFSFLDERMLWPMELCVTCCRLQRQRWFIILVSGCREGISLRDVSQGVWMENVCHFSLKVQVSFHLHVSSSLTRQSLFWFIRQHWQLLVQLEKVRTVGKLWRMLIKQGCIFATHRHPPSQCCHPHFLRNQSFFFFSW